MALCKNVSIANRNESSLFYTVTFDAMMYLMERMFETVSLIIIEGNFVPADVKKVTIERGQANKIGVDVSYDNFDKWCHALDNFF